MSRPRKMGGTVYPRKDSAFWWITYRNREGQVVQESTGTTDRQEAERFLRQRLDARDEGVLPTILASKNLTFGQWATWFLENRSKPPFRAQNTHVQNLNAIQMLKPTFGDTRLLDITPEAIEEYLRQRLSQGSVTRRDLFREFSHENFGYFLGLDPAFAAFRCPGTMG
jgi:hypothetical protein